MVRLRCQRVASVLVATQLSVSVGFRCGGSSSSVTPTVRRHATVEKRLVEVATTTTTTVEDDDTTCSALERLGIPGPTVWSEFGELARNLQESYEGGVVNLGQGFPDWAPPDFVLEAAVAAASDTSAAAHQYTRTAGYPPLVDLLARRYAAHFGRPVDAMTEVAITVGCTQALLVSLISTIRKDDEVLIIEPFFDLYLGQIKLAGGIPVPVPMTAGDDGDWQLDAQKLADAITPRTRVLILNSPHNPTGKVFTAADMEAVAEVVRSENARRSLESSLNAKTRPLIVIADEVYKYIIHDQSVDHVHFAGLDGMADYTLTVSSAGKTFSATGWQVGWIVGPGNLVKNAQQLLPYLQFCAPTPMQAALTSALVAAEEPHMGSATYYDWLRSEYARKRVTLISALKTAGIRPLESSGGYFVIADVSALLPAVPDEFFLAPKFAGSTEIASRDWAFCKWLATVHGVVAIPASPFFDKHRPDFQQASSNYVRFAFCKSDTTLQAAALRLKTLAPLLATEEQQTTASSSSPPSS